MAVLRGAKSLVAPFISGHGGRTARSAEEINRDDALEFLVQPVEIGLIIVYPPGREMAAALLLADRSGQSVQLRRNLRVLLVTRLLECGADLRVGGPFDRAGPKDGRLATRRLDLLLEPLEIFVRLLVEG